jgi:myo-inositol 2-dehydrogenase/D-chiro-inositol 1-dehydrogenase
MSTHPYQVVIDDNVRDIQAPMPAGSTKPRFGFIGTGMMGCEHIHVTLSLGRAEIAAIHDPHQPSLDLANWVLDKHDAPQPTIHASIDTLCADESLDAIFICTPNFTHREVFDRVIVSGKPIFLEKPMATTLDDAIYIANVASSYPSIIQLGMQYRYKAQYLLAQTALEAGDLGEVKTVSMSEYRPPFLGKVDEWNKFAAYSGGTLVEKCCHYFDLINRVAQSTPKRVFASGGQAVNFLDFEHNDKRSDIDDHALVIVEYDNGVRGQFALNMFSEELYEELVVGGSRGRLHAWENASFKPGKPSSARIKVEVPDHPAYEATTCDYPESIERTGHYGSTMFEHDRFISALRGESSDAATASEGLWAIITAWMAQRSIETREVVDVRQALVDVNCDPFQPHLMPESLANRK